METIKGTIKVPACWKDLVEEVFDTAPEGLVGVNSTKIVLDAKNHRKADNDPDPYYDDARQAIGKLENDRGSVGVDLCSGQHNYYGGIWIEDVKNDDSIEAVLEDFEDTLVVEGKDRQYVIQVEWV